MSLERLDHTIDDATGDAAQVTDRATAPDGPRVGGASPIVALLFEMADARRLAYRRALEACGLHVITVRSGAEMLEKFHTAGPAVVVLSAQPDDMPSGAILRHLRAQESGLLILVTVPGIDVACATELMRAGATDVVDDLHDPAHFVETLHRALDRIVLGDGAAAHTGVARLQLFTRYQALFRRSEAMRRVEELALVAAGSKDPLLLDGEPGTGKQTIARAIHCLSVRANRPFVRLKVAAIPPDALESVLFGEETSTGRRGLVEEAHGGTLFIDEAFDVTPETRHRVIAAGLDGQFVRRRGRELRATDIRLIWATTADVRALVTGGAVRATAVDALGTRISVPALRERQDEIPGLIEHFRQMYSRRVGRAAAPPPADACQMMREHTWPGNVGELEHVVKRWVAFQDATQLRQELETRLQRRSGTAVPGRAAGATSLGDIGRQAAREAERRALQETLAQVGWNRAAAARALKVSYKTLLQKLTETGLDDRPRRGRKL